MDAVTERAPAATTSSRVYLPAEAPLTMPTQSLSAKTDRPSRPDSAPPLLGLRRLFLFGVTIAMTIAAAHEMYLVLAVGGLTILEIVVMALFLTLFAWIAFSFANMLCGLIGLTFGRGPMLGIDPTAPLPALSVRTALLVPTYNEEPHRVIARIHAIDESIAQTGAQSHFDIFILSDTTDPDVWIAEEKTFLELRARTGGQDRIFYRRRPDNHARKAGNIAEWVTRFGGAYENMLILDADSLMTGDTIVRLAAAMERHPAVGLIQTLPVIVNATTPFARIQQFAGRLYGPLIARGIAFWHGPDGNYWGHNAMIRTGAFARFGGLPALRGPRPIGGHILSHDFVEAALMRRGGAGIHMVTNIGGSFEECPPSLTEYAARDRRWCQGNLQHMGVLPARGLHWISRLHLLTGIGSYIAAPLWLIFLLVGIVISLQAQFIRPEYFPKEFSLFPQWPAQDPVRAAFVFAGTMALLLTPKLFGWLASLFDGTARRGFGGGVRGFFSMLLEVLVSGLMAPVMMLIQSRAVFSILMGHDGGWQPQRRDDGGVPALALLRIYGGYTLFGLVLAIAAYQVSFYLFVWMSPVIVGLLLAFPLALWTSSARAGRWLRRLGLLVVPEERAPPQVLVRANELASVYEPSSTPTAAFDRLLHDPALLAAHRDMLPEKPPRSRGDVEVPLVVGLAKLADCPTLDEARAVLTRAEKLALLGDARGLKELQRISETNTLR
jgi:membrane glycosyltransferase